MKEELKKFYNLYKTTLIDEVMPYWLKYSEDVSGAINNCLSEDGKVLVKDRYMWSQGRALWTFSAMYNRIKRDDVFLKRADGLFRYIVSIGTSKDGHWNYRYDEFGKMLDDDISIYVDGFVLAGMTEYYKATGNEVAKDIALKTYENTLKRIHTPGSFRVAPYVIPKGMKTHGVNMIFTNFYYELGKALGRRDILDEAVKLADEILDDFFVKEKNAILEFINVDGSFSDTPEGRSCVPGHAIECMWFLINIFNEEKQPKKVLKCCEIIRRHVELAWDNKKGGLILALDIDGKTPVFWGKPTYKPWWVQLEAMVATMHAYKYTKDNWYLEMHKKISDFAFSHYPNGYGDWYNWLDNDGNIGESAALPVKDPFHLPRALMTLIDLIPTID